MKTIFDQALRETLVPRIYSLNEDRKAQWGKMNIYQMVQHCIIWDKWVLGVNNPKYKQEFIGLIFGKIALKGMVKDDRPLKKGLPAGRGFEVKEADMNLEAQKQIWVNLIASYANYSNNNFIHDFFGKMSREEIGIFAYKHSDHHLRQFGV